MASDATRKSASYVKPTVESPVGDEDGSFRLECRSLNKKPQENEHKPNWHYRQNNKDQHLCTTPFGTKNHGENEGKGQHCSSCHGQGVE